MDKYLLYCLSLSVLFITRSPKQTFSYRRKTESRAHTSYMEKVS